MFGWLRQEGPIINGMLPFSFDFPLRNQIPLRLCVLERSGRETMKFETYLTGLTGLTRYKVIKPEARNPRQIRITENEKFKIPNNCWSLISFEIWILQFGIYLGFVICSLLFIQDVGAYDLLFPVYPG